MNNSCTINCGNLIKYDFAHIFTYKLLIHIMVYYDLEIGRVKLDKQDLIVKYTSNYYSVKKAIEELLDREIIKEDTIRKNWYFVNKEIINKFK